MEAVPAFDRRFFRSSELFARIGEGDVGGKAAGLVEMRSALEQDVQGRIEGIDVVIPRVVVLATDGFDAFMARNDLYAVAEDDHPDDRLAHAFQRADLPPAMLGDLRALAEEARQPLAVRSSSLLEDALERPFAGVYETKMLPNNQPDADHRFRALVEAVKLVYASTFFRTARTYRRAAGLVDRDEKMAVMIQEIVGNRHDTRFYPVLSAVCRSYSYYPIGKARREDGVASLALGLGKTIVDGGLCWSYSPRRPKAPRPFGSVRQMLAETQKRFWAVNMAARRAPDPTAPAEYLVSAGLQEAEYDGTLRSVASTYDGGSDRLRPGTGIEGPRVLDFAPLLKLRTWPLNDVVQALLETASATADGPVEIELAMTVPKAPGGEARAGLVQVRPMMEPREQVEVDRAEIGCDRALLGSDRAMGNGTEVGVRDVVYVDPQRFNARETPVIARDVEAVNARLLDEGRPYLLIGFGRWGSSDPWLGIPVDWGQVVGARAIVEATRPDMDVEPSQGSHFFHNLSSTGVLYFAVRHDPGPGIDWAWLDAQTEVCRTERLRHVRTATPLEIRVDGRTGLGVVLKGEGG
jgi:hypothetical protein